VSPTLYLLLFLHGVLALTLLMSGAAKLIDSAGFKRALTTYQVFPAPMIYPLTRTVPLIELGLAIWLLTGLVPRLSVLAITIILAAFTAVIAWNLIRGVRFSCGCFGSDSVPATWLTVWRNLALLAMSGYLLFYPEPTLPSINSYDGMMILLTAAAVLGAIFVGFSWHRLSEMHSPRVVSTDATGERAQTVEVQQ